ncbi:TIGR01777 family protein [Nibricoccus aquaticus]|uniref:TIGR01777 family protein n=1 Tax=Nibricoccus aquaticus TaxID=2576891 RepID=A0A290Q2B8_9BACT|nr:TIGR01777 family oxidoreductase [Nibricoccus aquaticus]ATC62789.1 TIGR01777 family protein [Nibricoccus aquaticus]
MSLQTFSRSIRISRPASEVFAWHLRPGALERLMPPWERAEVVKHVGVANGARVVVKSKVGPFWPAWDVEHCDVIEDKQFRDVQISGPFKRWEHTHRIEAEGSAECVLTDEIIYELPGGVIGNAVAGGWVRRKLERLFTYRHEVTRADVELAFRYGAVRPMTFLVAGASGLVGGALVPFLKSQGHTVVRLVRREAAGAGEIFWNPAKGELDAAKLRGVDVVINLAGENVAGGRWTAARREAILSSRVAATRTLVSTIEKMKHRPFVLVSASATGIYGNRGEERVNEESMRGTGFLADVCKAWEKETGAAEALGLRAVALRAGVVLTPAGGALAKMLPAFRAGLGGKMGSGRQWMSWIGVEDFVGAIYHAVIDQRCGGPVNAVAPGAVTNAEFAETLARVLGKRAWLSVPAWTLKAALGQMAEEALLSGVRVEPARLDEARYEFRHGKLEDALRHVLGR